MANPSAMNRTMRGDLHAGEHVLHEPPGPSPRTWISVSAAIAAIDTTGLAAAGIGMKRPR